MECGRPVLIVPNAGVHSRVGERMLVAWNGRRVGEMLIACADEMSADLLVMGCSGHARHREFGGASRHVLRHMTLPVLMSH